MTRYVNTLATFRPLKREWNEVFHSLYGNSSRRRSGRVRISIEGASSTKCCLIAEHRGCFETSYRVVLIAPVHNNAGYGFVRFQDRTRTGTEHVECVSHVIQEDLAFIVATRSACHRLCARRPNIKTVIMGLVYPGNSPMMLLRRW